MKPARHGAGRGEYPGSPRRVCALAGHRLGGMTTNAPRQLRLIIETDDFDEALQFYRDVLGMRE